MRNIKSFIASVSIAVSTLAFVAVSVPAQARTPFTCTHCTIYGNGTSLNGFKYNGFRINGFKINGVRMNGPILQGVRLNGIYFNGMRLNSPVLQGIQPQGTQFVGMKRGEPVAITLPDGETVGLR